MQSILFSIGTLGLGGAELQLTMLAIECKRRDVNCSVFVLDPHGPLKDLLKQHQITIVDGGYRYTALKWTKPFLILRSCYRLQRFIRKMKPSVVHAYLPLTNFLSVLSGRVARHQRIVISHRALGTHQERHPFWWLLDRFASHFCHYATVNSMAVLNDTIQRNKTSPNKLALIHNGVDFSRFNQLQKTRAMVRETLGLSPDVIGIISVANLIPYKGHTELLSAVAKLDKRFQYKLFLVGEDRSIGHALKQLAIDLDILHSVCFMGQRHDIPELLSAMDIFVLASHEEGLSNAIIEAMVSELAIIATDVGGNSELLEGGTVGRLVPVHQSDVLAFTMQELIHDSTQRVLLGSHAKNSALQRFAIDTMVDKHIELYRKLFRASD